jgi:hypothetical protein
MQHEQDYTICPRKPPSCGFSLCTALAAARATGKTMMKKQHLLLVAISKAMTGAPHRYDTVRIP